MNKLFCIGLSRTGTRSLTIALNTLGIKTVHCPSDEETFLHISNGFYKLPILEHCQGLADIIATTFYPQFDETYPGSKFILTLREKASWLPSIANRVGGVPEGPYRNDKISEFKKFLRASFYGSHRYNEKRFSYVYDVFHRNVHEYFKNRPQDLLTLDMFSGQGWDVLCPFLGTPIPNTPFPSVGGQQANRPHTTDSLLEHEKRALR